MLREDTSNVPWVDRVALQKCRAVCDFKGSIVRCAASPRPSFGVTNNKKVFGVMVSSIVRIRAWHRTVMMTTS